MLAPFGMFSLVFLLPLVVDELGRSIEREIEGI